MNNDFSDLLIRIQEHDNTPYPVEATLSDGSHYEGALELGEEDLQELRTRERADPLAYGARLFEKLFCGQIGIAYAVAQGLARKKSNSHLRIRLALAHQLPGQVQALKWERLCHAEEGQPRPLVISEHTPFSRYRALSIQEPHPLDEPIIYLLIVISSPSNLAACNLTPIDVPAELYRLAHGLQEVLASHRCKVTILPGRSFALIPKDLKQTLKSIGCTLLDVPATLDAITEHLYDQDDQKPVHVLHFLGHGHYLRGEGALYLEAADGTVAPAGEEELAARLGNSQLQLVFLAACDSARCDLDTDATPANPGEPAMGLAPALIAAGVPAVVAMQEQVDIDRAYKLTGEFYRRLLLEHGSVDLALNQARKMLYDGEDAEWATPVLYSRIQSGQLMLDNPLFAALQRARAHSDYAIFRDGSYFSLPLHAMVVNPGQQFSYFEAPDVQPSGTVSLIDAAWQWLCDPRPCSSLLLILGGAGTSKSTQLKRLAWKSIENGLAWAGQYRFLPLYLDQQQPPFAGALSAETLEQQILTKLKLFWNDLKAATLAELPESVRLRVFVNGSDALPEVANDLLEQMAYLTRTYTTHQFVLALQPIPIHWKELGDGKDSVPYVLAIQPLAQRTLRHFLEAEERFGQTLLDAIQDAYLFDLASIPYFTIKMFRNAQRGKMPGSRTSFLKQIIDEGIAKLSPTDGVRANAVPTLHRLAWEMQRQRTLILPLNHGFQMMEQLRENRGYTSEKLYMELEKNELLQPVGEYHMRFAYHSLQSYLCAEAILDQPDRARAIEEIVETLGFPSGLRWWEETIVVLCGLLASDPQPTAPKLLHQILEPLIYGTNLLEGDAVFLAARCLVECRQHGRSREWQALVDHVVHALRWRTDYNNETQWTQRLQATQLLAHLAMPQVTIELAKTAYDKVRKNLVDEWDYEFSSVRFAAAIALKKLSPAAAATVLGQINPQMADLFKAWKGKKVDAIVEFSKMTEDQGIQGIAALALGDLCGRCHYRGAHAEQAFSRLVEMFTDGEMRQSVRWPVADALSLLDLTLVTQRVIHPLVHDLADPQAAQLARPNKIRKSLAYLIGLLRLSDPQTRHFLLEECLGTQAGEPLADWSTWSTAIGALGKIADQSDATALVEIASGKWQGIDLNSLFKNSRQANYIRTEAITALANLGRLTLFDQQTRRQLADDPTFTRIFYRTMRTMYWWQGTQADTLSENGMQRSLSLSRHQKRAYSDLFLNRRMVH